MEGRSGGGSKDGENKATDPSSCWRSCEEVYADRGSQAGQTLERSLACSINYIRGMCSTVVWGEGPSRTR